MDFEEMYAREFPGVYKYLFALCGEQTLAEELTQETFFRAIQSIETFRGTCKLSVWLCQIGKNLYLSQMRRGVKRKFSTRRRRSVLAVVLAALVALAALTGKTARDISDEALLQIARRLEGQVSTMDIRIMNGWPTECDYSDYILDDMDTECCRVIGYTSAADVLRATEEIWYRYASRSDPTFEQVFAPHIPGRYVARNGALYRHDMGMGDGGIVNVVDQLISRTADRAIFSGYSTYDGEERLSTFQMSPVCEDGAWKYRSIG